MEIDLNNLDILVLNETLQAIRETLDPHLGDADDEKKRQKSMAAAIKKRDLHAADEKDETNEAEEDEEETKEEESEDQPTGVPETIDKDEDEAPREDRTGGKGTKDSPKLDTPSEKQLNKPTIGNVIDKLNALRGGKSLKDPAVMKSFSQYFKNLTEQERTSLLVFLTGMSQILAGVATGADALDPGDVGLRVKDTARTAEKTKKKLSTQKAKEKQQSAGTEAAPIIVGESQQKHHLRRIFERYRIRG